MSDYEWGKPFSDQSYLDPDWNHQTFEEEIELPLAYEVSLFYERGKVNPDVVRKIRETFQRYDHGSLGRSQGADTRVSRTAQSVGDRNNTLTISIFIDSRYDNLQKKYDRAPVAENELMLMIEDTTTGFVNPLVSSDAFFIKAGRQAVRLLERVRSENHQVRSGMDDVIPFGDAGSPLNFSQEIMLALWSKGKYEGIKTSMDSIVNVADGVAYAFFGAPGGIYDFLGDVLLKGIVEPIKNMVSIPSYYWDPQDIAWNPKAKSPPKKEPGPRDHWVWYKKPKPAHSRFIPFVFQLEWPPDASPTWDWADAIAIDTEEEVAAYIGNKIAWVTDQLHNTLDLLYQPDALTNLMVDGLGYLGLDLSFIKEWSTWTADLVRDGFRKSTERIQNAVAEMASFWFSMKNRLVLTNAFICGLINSIIDAILGPFELLGALFKFMGFTNSTMGNMGAVQRKITEMSEDLRDTLFGSEADSGWDLDSALANAISMSMTGMRMMRQGIGYIAKEITMVRTAYFIGALVEFVLEIVVSILVTMGTKLVLDFLNTLGKVGKAILKVIQFGMKINKLFSLPQDKVMELLMGWVFDFFGWLIGALKKGGKEIMEATGRLTRQFVKEVDDEIAPFVQREIKENLGIDLSTLKNREGLHFSSYEGGELRLIQSNCL